MLTLNEYVVLKTRLDKHNAWVDSIRGRNGWASYKPEQVPANLKPEPTNDERSTVEVYEFCQNPPTRYFLYIGFPKFGEPAIATTWTGDKLGDVSFGTSYRSNFGDKRVPVTIRAINGKTYHGIYYSDAGTYARVKLSKGSTDNA